MKKYLLSVTIILLLISAVMGGCAKEAVPEVKEPVKIGLITYMSGVAFKYGKMSVDATNLAIRQIYDRGGILGGRPIEVLMFDEGFTPETSISSTKEALAKGCTAIVGGQDATTAPSIQGVCREAGVPFVSLTCALSDLVTTGQYWGHVHVGSYGTPMIRALLRRIEAQGYKRVIHICCESEWEYVIVDALWHEYFGRPGSTVEVLPSIIFPYEQSTCDLEMTKAIAQNPDFILNSSYTHIPALAKIQELGWEGGYMVDYGELFLSDTEEAGELAEGIYIPTWWNYDSTVPANKAFRDAWFHMYGEEPTGLAEVTYEGMMTMLLAMDMAGSDSDTQKIGDAFHSLDWMTPRGAKWEVWDNGQVFVRYHFMVQVQNGKWVTIDTLPLLEEDWEEGARTGI